MPEKDGFLLLACCTQEDDSEIGGS
jgi:hypothetical protein